MQARNLDKKAILSLLGLGLAALLIVGLTAGSSGATVAPSQSDDPREFSTGEPGAGSSQFSVLEPVESHAVSDIPSSVASLLAYLPADVNGQSTGTINSLGLPPSGSVSSQVVLAEVGDMLCVLATGDEYQGAVVGNCFPMSVAEAGGGYVVVEGVPNGSARLIGVAPNGVARVSIDSGADGSIEEKVDATGNVYQAELDMAAPATVSGLSAGGEVQFQAQLPVRESAR